MEAGRGQGRERLREDKGVVEVCWDKWGNEDNRRAMIYDLGRTLREDKREIKMLEDKQGMNNK